MGSRVSLIGWCPALNRLRYCWSVSCLCQADINVVSTVQALIHCQLVYSITSISWPPLVHSIDTRCWRSTLGTWLTGWERHIYSMCVCVCMLGIWLTGWECHIYSMCVCVYARHMADWMGTLYLQHVCVCVYARHMADRMGMPYLQHVCVCVYARHMADWMGTPYLQHVCVYFRHMADRMGTLYLQHVCVYMLGTWLTGWERCIYSSGFQTGVRGPKGVRDGFTRGPREDSDK